MGYNPTDFWDCPPADYWLVIEAKQEATQGRDRSQYAGMTRDEAAAIYQETYGG
jgi:lysozyme family protein